MGLATPTRRAPGCAARHALRCATLTALLVSAPLGARAAEPGKAEVREPHWSRNDFSPQNAAVELRFGPYRPKIDESVSEPVYSDFFGDDARFMIGLEVDWQALRVPLLGTLGLGFGWGYTQMSGTNLPIDDSVTGRISQESSLDIMPFYGVGVLRIDSLARNFHIPIVPYGKLGLAMALWWVNDGIGTATSDAGVKGKDVSTGVHAAVGGMFLLDILEPSAARAADADGGVNNSYLFFEWAMSDYGGDQMNVGSSNWVTGLAFEM